MADNDYEGLYESDVAGYIMSKCDQWRDHYETNYQERFDEYYRLWRGIWAPEDTLRNSERSRLIGYDQKNLPVVQIQVYLHVYWGTFLLIFPNPSYYRLFG